MKKRTYLIFSLVLLVAAAAAIVFINRGVFPGEKEYDVDLLMVKNGRPKTIDVLLNGSVAAVGQPFSGTAVQVAVPSDALLSSNPGAQAKLFLDFRGDPGSYNTPAYSRDSDYTSFSRVDIDAMKQIWASVAEKYSPFNIDVTTIDPGNRDWKKTMRILIGGGGSWTGVPGVTGTTETGSFAYQAGDRTGYVFSDNILHGDPRMTAEVAAHEAGHGFGLTHQAAFSPRGELLSAYNTGNGTSAPIMGNSLAAPRGLWWSGFTQVHTPQDDEAIIAGEANGFGYRQNNIGHTAHTAQVLGDVTAGTSISGIIEKVDDQNYYSVITTGTSSIQITATSARYGAMLDLALELQNRNGERIIRRDQSGLTKTITTQVPAGTYYIIVSSRGGYGDVGQYSLSVRSRR